MIESKQFAGGGMNQDVYENYLKPNEWQDARNIRVTDRLDGTEGVISNVKGNTEVEYTLPSGTNRCIGNYANEQTGKMYSFIWNSLGNHRITEYNSTAGTITTVLGGSFLNFQQYELINGAGVVDGNLLYWTDGYNPPRSIEIDRAKTGTWYTDSDSISLIKKPPTAPIVGEYSNSTTGQSTSLNKLKNQLFQFRYLYVYTDNSRSAWSSASRTPYPQLEATQSVSSEAFRNNNIILSFDVGEKYVKTVEIAAIARGATDSGISSDWYSIFSVDRADLISDPKYLYDSATNLCSYAFFNDGLYQPVDIREIDLPYDFVPLKSKCLDIVNGNVLVLANNTEGYDNIEVDVTLTTSYENRIDTLRMSVETSEDYTTSIFSGVPLFGDEIQWSLEYFDALDEFISKSGTYTVSSEESGSLIDVVRELVKDMVAESNFNVAGVAVPNEDGTVTATITGKHSPTIYVNFVIVLAATSTLSSNASYKTNSKYQFGLVYYDEFNRSSYVQTSSSCVVATSSWGSVSGSSPKISWEIGHTAPLWASYYQWVRTEQLTHKDFTYLVATNVTEPMDKDYYELDITPLTSYNITNPNSIIDYDFTPGDRCTIHQVGATWKSGMDVPVVGVSGSTLFISKGISLTTGVNDVLIEVYTPKTRVNQPTQQFYYEFGEIYSCSGGVHSALTGEFVEGDIFCRERVFDTNITIGVEDPNFSDFYISNYSSNGRTNIFAPQAKQLTLPTDIRYSDTYVPNTNINGLSRFYGDAYETYDRVNGSIQKLATRDNYLFCFQELKTGYIPVFQSIIEDQGAQDPNVAISTKLLNKIRYLAGDYGVGLHPESFARFAGTMYFADPNRGQVLKLTSGLQPISIVGMDKYFTSKLSEFNEIATAKIYGSYDPYNDEYIVTFKETSGFTENDQTIAWSESINRWTTFYDFTPDIGGYIFNKYFTYLNARMYEHNVNDSRNSFYGQVKSSSISVVFNGSPAGIKTFLGLMNQSTTAWSLGDSIRTSEGQSSELFLEDFTEKEGVFMASFFKADNSPGGLFSGDALKGNWIKFRLSNGLATKDIIQALHMRFIPSNQGIK